MLLKATVEVWERD